MNIRYHPIKTSVIADALSRISMGNVLHLKDDGKMELARVVHKLARLGLNLSDTENVGVMMVNGSKSSLIGC